MTDSQPYPPRRYAWFVVFVLILASLIAFIDRQVVAIVVGPMQQDLGVGDTEIGWLYGVFALFYAAAALPIATLADKRSRKHIIAIGIFLWSLLTIACGLTRSYWQIFLARIGVGIGEATLTPATTSLIGDYFPRKLVPLALSIFQAGPIIGTGLAFIIGGYVLNIVESSAPMTLPFFGELKPWQQTFVYVGVPGLILAVFFLGLKEPIRRLDAVCYPPRVGYRAIDSVLPTKCAHHHLSSLRLRMPSPDGLRFCVLVGDLLCPGSRLIGCERVTNLWLDFRDFWAAGSLGGRVVCRASSCARSFGCKHHRGDDRRLVDHSLHFIDPSRAVCLLGLRVLCPGAHGGQFALWHRCRLIARYYAAPPQGPGGRGLYVDRLGRHDVRSAAGRRVQRVCVSRR